MAIKRAIKAGDKSITSFKKVIKVGEITQLVSKDNIPATKIQQGVTFTNNGDGSVTANGASTNQYYSEIDIRIGGVYQWQEDDHKYLLLSGINSNDNWKIECILYVGRLDGQPGQAYNAYDAADLSSRFDFTIPKGQYLIKSVKCRIRSGYTAENVTFTPQLFDLTEMFGAGHEPTTVAEFKAKFPDAYYPYQRAVLTVYNKAVRPCARKGEVVQVADLSSFASPYTRSGITFTNNGDGSVTVNGTATADSYVILQPISKSIAGAVYLLGSEQNTLEYGVANGLVLPTDKWTYDPGTSTTGAHTNYTLVVKNGVTVNNVTIFPQIYNLTAMYGAGNEPKTLADFRKDFPESYYPYNSIHTKNLWTCNKTSYFFSYNKTTQIYTINGTGSNSCYTLPSPISAGQTFTISVKCLSGWIPDGCVVNFGGYHKEGNVLSWQTTVELPREQDLTGKIFTATKKTTDTLTDFWIFIYAKIPTNLRVMIQFEKGSVATDYVPHDYI